MLGGTGKALPASDSPHIRVSGTGGATLPWRGVIPNLDTSTLWAEGGQDITDWEAGTDVSWKWRVIPNKIIPATSHRAWNSQRHTAWQVQHKDGALGPSKPQELCPATNKEVKHAGLRNQRSNKPYQKCFDPNWFSTGITVTRHPGDEIQITHCLQVVSDNFLWLLQPLSSLCKCGFAICSTRWAIKGFVF